MSERQPIVTEGLPDYPAEQLAGLDEEDLFQLLRTHCERLPLIVIEAGIHARTTVRCWKKLSSSWTTWGWSGSGKPK